MSRFATRFKHRQHTENITDDDEFPIHIYLTIHGYIMNFHYIFVSLSLWRLLNQLAIRIFISLSTLIQFYSLMSIL